VLHTLTYIGGLFEALEHVHASRVLHRDIKPSNALYSFERRETLLVDFGLAERMRAQRPSPPARAAGSAAARGRAVGGASAARASASAGRGASGAQPSAALGGGGGSVSRRGGGTAENLPSPPRTRAGTKGFRAPECLLGVDERTGAVDVWSAGVILLSVLTRQYPFFSAADDIDQLWEIALLRGAKALRAMGREFGKGLELASPAAAPDAERMPEEPQGLEAISVRSLDAIPHSRVRSGLVALAEQCLDVNPRTRITAKAAHAAICELRKIHGNGECATEPAESAAVAAPAAEAAEPPRSD
jgi:cell division control protein 7